MKSAAIAALTAVALLAPAATPAAQRARKPRRPAAAAPASAQAFERAKARAEAARLEGRYEEAARLYLEALQLRPKWDEGWWHLATLLYDRDDYAGAARAFENAAALKQDSGIARAMLGLCLYRLGRYDDALGHIIYGLKLGIGDSDDLNRVVRYHEGVLLNYKGEFEVAQQRLHILSGRGVDNEPLTLALGLAALRISTLPERLDPSRRDYEMVRRAGRAEHYAAQRNRADSQREYDRLVTDYPNEPGVQYAYGRFLLTQQSNDAAIAAFEREIKNSPSHALARLQIAYVRLVGNEPEKGLPYAEEAVRLQPGSQMGNYILGRLLLETGATERAVEALEIARRLNPSEPKIYFSLARAYGKLGRKADADMARQTFAKLSQQQDAATRRAEAIPEAEGDPERAQP